MRFTIITSYVTLRGCTCENLGLSGCKQCKQNILIGGLIREMLRCINKNLLVTVFLLFCFLWVFKKLSLPFCESHTGMAEGLKIWVDKVVIRGASVAAAIF